MDHEFFASGQHGLTLAEVENCLKKPELIAFLDVRTEEEARYLEFGNVQHIPLEQLPDRIKEVPRNQPVVVFCTSVVRASMAAFYLKAEGITSARTLLANSEKMVRLFTLSLLLPVEVLPHHKIKIVEHERFRLEKLKSYFREMNFNAFGEGGFTTPATAIPLLIKNGTFLLDLRTREEAEALSLPFAKHIPLNELPDRLEELPQEAPVIAFSQGPWRSSVALAYLTAKGFDQVSVIPQGLPEILKMLKPGPLHSAGVRQVDQPLSNSTPNRVPCNC